MISNNPTSDSTAARQRFKDLMDHCRAYKDPDIRRSVFQLVSTALIYFAGLAALYVAVLHHAYIIYALIYLPISALLIRFFCIQHDCGHGSFFNSRLANDMTGRFISLFTFLPYTLWKTAHNMHHAGSGNLSRRGSGDVDTLTVKEYNALSPRARFLYRFYRHPLVLLLLGPPVYVLILQRFPPMQSVPFLKYERPIPVSNAWRSVVLMDISLLAFYGAVIFFLGWKAVFLVQIPVLVGAFVMGQWLFFVQHQFENTYWAYDDNWNLPEAAFRGSSYYALHPVLQWLTGNIGFHHIHHMCSMIPNYRLQECCEASEEFSSMGRITLLESFKCIRLALWDEAQSKMIRFRDLKKLQPLAA